jgi:hypothetical protein
MVLRALVDEEWEVSEKPDWVTVSPMSGTGRTEITVTINELAQGSANRSGRVVFSLKDTDHTVFTTVEQYNYVYGDNDFSTKQTASQGSGINLVFMGDGFDAKEISEGKYAAAMDEAVRHFFAVEPYTTYQSYFSAHYVYNLSRDSGLEDPSTMVENKFNTGFRTGKIAADATPVFEAACNAPIDGNVAETVIILVPNTTDYGGICYMYGDGSAIAICPMSADAEPYDFRGTVQHEAGGHAFAKLGDEYIYTHNFVDRCTCSYEHADDLREGQNRGWYQNLSLSNSYGKVPWSDFIFHPDYANTVDVFEGGWYHTRNVWRSEHNSCMNNNIPYVNAVSRREIVMRLKTLAGETYTFEDFLARDVMGVSPSTRSWEYTPLQGYSSKPMGLQSPPVYMGEKPVFNKPKKK